MVTFTEEIPNGKSHLTVQGFLQSIFYVLIKWKILLLMFVINLLVTRTVVGRSVLTEGFRNHSSEWFLFDGKFVV